MSFLFYKSITSALDRLLDIKKRGTSLWCLFLLPNFTVLLATADSWSSQPHQPKLSLKVQRHRRSSIKAGCSMLCKSLYFTTNSLHTTPNCNRNVSYWLQNKDITVNAMIWMQISLSYRPQSQPIFVNNTQDSLILSRQKVVRRCVQSLFSLYTTTKPEYYINNLIIIS